MLKQNREALRDNKKMSSGWKFEEVVAKSLKSKNKSREVFGNLKEQGISSGNKDSRKQQPFQKASLFRDRGNRGGEIFSPVGPSISNAGTQKKGKNTFSHTQAQHTQSPVPRKVLQDTPISDTSVSSEHSNFTKGRKVEIFSQKLGKTNKQPHNFGDSAKLQYLFNCATIIIDSPKSGNNVTRGNIFDRPGDQRIAQKRCNFSSKKSGVSVSELTVFGKEKRWEESSSGQSKRIE